MENIKISSNGTTIKLKDKNYDLSKSNNGFADCLKSLKLKDDKCKDNNQFMSALKSVYDELGKKNSFTQQMALRGALSGAGLGETAEALPKYITSTVSSKTSGDLPIDVDEITSKSSIEKNFKDLFVQIENLRSYNEKEWKKLLKSLNEIRECFEKNNSIREKYAKTYAVFYPAFTKIKASFQEKEKNVEFKNQRDLCTNLSLSKLVKGKIGTFGVVWTDKCAKNLSNFISEFLKQQNIKTSGASLLAVDFAHIEEVYKNFNKEKTDLKELSQSLSTACKYLKFLSIKNEKILLATFGSMKSGIDTLLKMPDGVSFDELFEKLSKMRKSSKN